MYSCVNYNIKQNYIIKGFSFKTTILPVKINNIKYHIFFKLGFDLILLFSYLVLFIFIILFLSKFQICIAN